MEAFKLLQLASAYGSSMLAYKLNGTPRPFSASFAVSNRCNIHCSYCNFPSMDPRELKLDEIRLVLGKLKKMGVKRLGLLGGEPLLRKDILQVISLAKEHGFFISLNTNLLLYPKFAGKLEEIDHFFTSLDGDREKHEANRGKQSYDRIVDAIRDLVNRQKKITAICVVTGHDKYTADYLIDFATREQIEVHFQPECYDTEIVQRSAPANIEASEIRNFWQYLYERKKQGAPIASSSAYLKYISEWGNYSVSSYHEANEKCAAGSGFLFVDAQGYAFPCAYTKGKVEGINLLESEWEKAFDKSTACTRCIVGPMLEFNLLFKKPIPSILNALEEYS